MAEVDRGDRQHWRERSPVWTTIIIANDECSSPLQSRTRDSLTSLFWWKSVALVSFDGTSTETRTLVSSSRTCSFMKSSSLSQLLDGAHASADGATRWDEMARAPSAAR